MMSSLPDITPHYLARTGHYRPGAHFGPRPLNDFELVWIISGSARWRFTEGGQTHEHHLAPGSVILARAGGVDEYFWDSRHPSSHGYVHFSWPEEQSTTSGQQPAWPLVQDATSSRTLRPLCDYLLTLARMDSAQASSRHAQILALIVDLFRHGPFRDESVGPRSVHVRTAFEFVRDQWSRTGITRISLAELAIAARISQGHLARDFSAEFGGGIIAALEMLRLAHAAIRLQRSDDSVQQVAYATGFSDPYHFSRRFSRTYGLPPGRYRRQHRADDPLAPITAAGLVALWNIVDAVDPVRPRRP